MNQVVLEFRSLNCLQSSLFSKNIGLYNQGAKEDEIKSAEIEFGVKFSAPNGANFDFQYYIKDHLGNTRVVFNSANTILQEYHYYPFGMKQENTSFVTPSGLNEKHRYNSKEFYGSNLNFYDYGARWYDAAIGRFGTIDRFSDMFATMSGYQYGANNPIKYIDVNGDSIWIYDRFTVFINGISTIKTEKYFYGKSISGTNGFIDKNGNIYSGSNNFIKSVSTALNKLESGKTGAELVNYLVTITNNLEIGKSRRNAADFTSGRFVTWDPEGNSSAVDQTGSTSRPSYIGLGHELAHIQDIWKATISLNTWRSIDGKDIPYAEIYATHIENLLRAENNLSLRVSYGVTATGGIDDETKLINSKTGQSLYYNASGITTYKKIKADFYKYK